MAGPNASAAAGAHHSSHPPSRTVDPSHATGRHARSAGDRCISGWLRRFVAQDLAPTVLRRTADDAGAGVPGAGLSAVGRVGKVSPAPLARTVHVQVREVPCSAGQRAANYKRNAGRSAAAGRVGSWRQGRPYFYDSRISGQGPYRRAGHRGTPLISRGGSRAMLESEVAASETVRRNGPAGQ